MNKTYLSCLICFIHCEITSIFSFYFQLLVSMVTLVFPEFSFEWLVEEMKKNLPKELDFSNEGRNAEAVAAQFSHFPWLKVQLPSLVCHLIYQLQIEI